MRISLIFVQFLTITLLPVMLPAASVAGVGAVVLEQLGACYTAPNAGGAVVLAVTLDANGDLARLPVLRSDMPVAGARAVLDATVQAVIDCSPLSDAEGRPVQGDFEVRGDVSGLSLGVLDLVLGPAPVVAPIVEAPASVLPAGVPVIVLSAVADQNSEAILGLDKAARREIQGRLAAMNYDPRGIDGVFGRGTRRALAGWQKDNGIAATGYLDANQLAQLREASQAAYEVWLQRPKRYVDSKGCLREPNGVIVPSQSFRCDLAAAGQNLGLSR